MRKSVFHKIIDGYDVITAIKEAVSNPAETMEAVRLRVGALPETAQVKAVTRKIIAQQKIMQDENAKALAKQEANPKADISLEEARWKQAQAAAAVHEEELKPLLAAIEAARLSLYEETAVYFDAGQDEKHLSEAEEAGLVPKFKNLGKHEALTLGGEIIPDNRGTEYHLKTDGRWEKAKIEAVGEALPEGAVLPGALTGKDQAEIAAQGEADRLAALTPDAKAAELQSRLDNLADEAYRLEQRARIQKTEFDAESWYEEKQAEIKAKYA